MDLKDILPLMMGSKNADVSKILGIANADDPQKMAGELLKGSDPRLASLLSLARPSKRRASGLAPILELANDEIAGKLAKHFASY